MPTKGHLQEAARDRRYQIFQNICVQHQIGVLLIAHHADDQAELFILRLSRNSGVLGLAGMAFTSQLYSTDASFYDKDTVDHGILLVRPLLEFSKEDMYLICRGTNQEWVEDPTNQSPIYARNRIRLALKELSSSVFNSDLQAVISACRRTRTFVDKICDDLIDRSVSVMPQGYAIIDLAILKPTKIKDLCLSKFVTLVLQFVSQRHRPVRGSALKLLLDYFRTIPSKGSFTAAGCYLCPAPGSRGTRILVCCSVHSTLPLKTELLRKLSFVPKRWSVCDMSEIIADRKSHMDHLNPDPSSVHFLSIKSSESTLIEARRLGILSEDAYTNLIAMLEDETEHFRSVTAEGYDDELKPEVNNRDRWSGTLRHGEVGYFMDRFIVRWDDMDNIGSGTYCKSCLLGHDGVMKVRHMVDADWLYLAKLARSRSLENWEEELRVISDGNECWNYVQSSAQRALVLLKSIPVAARRSLPVLDTGKGQLISIPVSVSPSGEWGLPFSLL